MSGPGDRLPVAPRERKPALAALAVLLILVGALGATVMVMRAGNKISAVEVIDDVAVGDKIPRADIREVMVADGTDVHYIRWSQREDLLAHYRAATNLTSHSVLVVSMLSTNADVLAPGKTLVGLTVKEGQYPAGLGNGLTVAAYLVGSDVKASTGGGDTGSGNAGPGGITPISDHLVIKKIDSNTSGGFGDGSETITVVADSADAGPLTVASAAGDVSLVLVPSKN